MRSAPRPLLLDGTYQQLQDICYNFLNKVKVKEAFLLRLIFKKINNFAKSQQIYKTNPISLKIVQKEKQNISRTNDNGEPILYTIGDRCIAVM